MRIPSVPAALILLQTLPAVAQPAPAPPPILVEGLPNPGYVEALREQVEKLPNALRKDYFRRLRKQQRQIKSRIEEMEDNLGRTESLRDALVAEGSANARKAAELMEAQKAAIAALKAMERAIARERRIGDTVILDAEDLKVDFYAGFQFSSLYRDPERSDSFFSRSRPFVALDMRQTFRWPENRQWVELFGTLSFQSSSKEKSDTVDVITTSGHFRGEAGAWWMRPLTDTVSVGLIGSVGLVGYTRQEEAQDLSTSSRDEFRNRTRIGITLRQEEGSFKGSCTEIGFARDPQFVHRDRLIVRGRVMLTQFGSQGSSGDFYMEGFVSKGRGGRDEAVLLLGLRLSTISFFRSLGSGGKR